MTTRPATRYPRWKFVGFLQSQEYWQEQVIRRQLLIWLAVGVAIRLVLMPFTAHNDWLDSHWRSEQMVEREIPYPTRAQFLSHAVDAAWLFIITPLLPERAELFAAPPSKNGRLDAQPSDFTRFIQQPASKRALFLTKFIYLMADILSACILLLLFANSAQGLLAFKIWMLNPATLFAIFIYGRYEAYALLCLVLALVFSAKNQKVLAVLAVGGAILFRMTPILLLPFFVLGLTKNRVAQIGLLLLGIFPFVLQIGVMEYLLKYIQAYNVDHPTGPFSGLTNATLTPFPLFPFVVGYVLLLFWTDQQPKSVFVIARAVLGVYLLMYAFTWHSAHYISWLAPFVVPLLAWGVLSVRYYVIFLIAWASYWLVATDAGVFTWYLFSPLIGYAYQPTPPGHILAQWVAPLQISYDQLIIAARSLLCGISLWLLLQLRLDRTYANQQS